MKINLTKEEAQALLALLHTAIKATGLSQETENALVFAKKISAAAAEDAKSDTVFAQANNE